MMCPIHTALCYIYTKSFVNYYLHVCMCVYIYVYLYKYVRFFLCARIRVLGMCECFHQKLKPVFNYVLFHFPFLRVLSIFRCVYKKIMMQKIKPTCFVLRTAFFE